MSVGASHADPYSDADRSVILSVAVYGIFHAVAPDVICRVDVTFGGGTESSVESVHPVGGALFTRAVR